MTLNEREAFWTEQLPIFKENYICLAQLDVLYFDYESGNFEIKEAALVDFEKEDFLETYHSVNTGWAMWLRAKSLEKAKAQAVPTWISVKDEEPSTDTMVLICWSDSPDVQPEIDYMTCDEDLNHIWANFEIDPPTHWMYFHKVPSESGAEQ